MNMLAEYKNLLGLWHNSELRLISLIQKILQEQEVTISLFSFNIPVYQYKFRKGDIVFDYPLISFNFKLEKSLYERRLDRLDLNSGCSFDKFIIYSDNLFYEDTLSVDSCINIYLRNNNFKIEENDEFSFVIPFDEILYQQAGIYMGKDNDNIILRKRNKYVAY